MGDPLRSGAIFRVQDVSVLRQSPAPRLLQTMSSPLMGASQSMAPSPVPQPSQAVPPPPASFVSPLLSIMSRNVEVLSAPLIKRERAPSPPRVSPPSPERFVKVLTVADIEKTQSAPQPVPRKPKPLPASPPKPSPVERIVSSFSDDDDDDDDDGYDPHEEDAVPEPIDRSRSSNEGLPAKQNSTSRAVADMDDDLPDTSSRQKVSLSRWHVRKLNPSADDNAVVVEGWRADKNLMWHSSEIKRRISTRMLQSVTGGIYRLLGNMDTNQQRANGFAWDFIERWRGGFPENWREDLDNALETWPAPPSPPRASKWEVASVAPKLPTKEPKPHFKRGERQDRRQRRREVVVTRAGSGDEDEEEEAPTMAPVPELPNARNQRKRARYLSESSIRQALIYVCRCKTGPICLSQCTFEEILACRRRYWDLPTEAERLRWIAKKRFEAGGWHVGENRVCMDAWLRAHGISYGKFTNAGKLLTVKQAEKTTASLREQSDSDEGDAATDNSKDTQDSAKKRKRKDFQPKRWDGKQPL